MRKLLSKCQAALSWGGRERRELHHRESGASEWEVEYSNALSTFWIVVIRHENDAYFCSV
jgi:hypothetical protein